MKISKIRQYFYLKFKKIKNYFVIFINRIKKSLKDSLIFESSLNHLEKLLKRFYVTSIGFEEINFGRKNFKRFKFCVLACIFLWIITLRLLLLILSNHFYSIHIINEFLPNHFKTFHLLIVLCIIIVSLIRTEFLISEIETNLGPFKVFYFLKNNIKRKHKLSDYNYKLLGILSRLITICLIDYGSTFISVIAISFASTIAILSKQIFWILEATLMIPLYSLSTFTTSAICIIFIIFFYYKFRFEQINEQIISALPKGNRKIINFRLEKLMINLIDEHNNLSIEMNKLNLAMRRLTAIMFILMALIKIIILYLIINIKNGGLIIIHLANLFIIFFLFGFGFTFLFTLQIKSAHKSYKLIHSIVCNYKMRLSFRLKVIQFKYFNFNKLSSILINYL